MNLACDNNVYLNPKVIIPDFEKTHRQIFRNIFPRRKIQRLFFHLVQIIWRCIQKGGLQKKYGRN